MGCVVAEQKMVFDTAFVKHALRGGVSAVDRDMTKVPPAVALRKNRPIRYRVTAERQRFCRIPHQTELRADGACVLEGDIVVVVPQDQETEYQKFDAEIGPSLRRDWVCTKPKHWLYRWNIDKDKSGAGRKQEASQGTRQTVPLPKKVNSRPESAATRESKSSDMEDANFESGGTPQPVPILKLIVPPRETLLQVWESQISGSHACQVCSNCLL